MKPNRICTVLAWAATALMLSACSVLPEKKPVTVYQLPLPPISAQAGFARPDKVPEPSTAERRVLRVNTPVASPTLNSDRILVSQAPYQVMAYQGVRWNDQVPGIVRNQLVQMLRASNQWQAVTTDATTARANYHLGGELTDFQVYERDGHRQVRIRLDATLTHAQTNRIIAAFPFSVSRTVDGTEFDAVIGAFGDAASQLGNDVARWVARQVNDSP